MKPLEFSLPVAKLSICVFADSFAGYNGG